MKTPIVIVDRNGVDLSVYDSVVDATRHLEADDVTQGAYDGYDADGRLLALAVAYQDDQQGAAPPRVNLVQIDVAESKPSHQAELRSALIRYLTALGALEAEVRGLSMPVLIERARAS
jgi:hypothetical protein